MKKGCGEIQNGVKTPWQLPSAPRSGSRARMTVLRPCSACHHPPFLGAPLLLGRSIRGFRAVPQLPWLCSCLGAFALAAPFPGSAFSRSFHDQLLLLDSNVDSNITSSGRTPPVTLLPRGSVHSLHVTYLSDVLLSVCLFIGWSPNVSSVKALAVSSVPGTNPRAK